MELAWLLITGVISVGLGLFGTVLLFLFFSFIHYHTLNFRVYLKHLKIRKIIREINDSRRNRL
jgi:hypothetical protein